MQGRNELRKTYNEPIVIIQTNDREEIKAPQSLVQKLATLANMLSDVGDINGIPLNQISSSQLRSVLALMESANDHQQLQGKRLYDAMAKDVSIRNPIEILKATNYLDLQPPVDKPVVNFLAKQIADEQDYPRWKPRKNIPLMKQLKDFGAARIPYGALIARYYFLRTGKNLPNLTQEVINNENYAFSIKEYLDNAVTHTMLSEKPGSWFSVGFDRFMPLSWPSSYESEDGIPAGTNNSVNLSRLNINDIEGLNEYRSYIHPDFQRRVKAIWLDHNKITSLIAPNSFRAFAGSPAHEGVNALVFSNNKITEIDPVVFNNLPYLRIIDLRNNPLTQAQIQQLRTAHPNKEFRF